MLLVGLGAEKYLQEAWPLVKGALKEHGISCELNLVHCDGIISLFLKKLLLGGEIIMW